MNLYRDCGPGGYQIDDWRDLWSAWWEGVAVAIRVRHTGSCACGCQLEVCVFCAAECSTDCMMAPR